MTIIMLLKGWGYKTICYRDMENDATRAIHVFETNHVISLFQIADLQAVYGDFMLL